MFSIAAVRVERGCGVGGAGVLGVLRFAQDDGKDGRGAVRRDWLLVGGTGPSRETRSFIFDGGEGDGGVV